MRERIFTISWDDGNVLDLKLLNLLDRYHLRGTFYIPKKYERMTLSDEQIKSIGKEQEIGAHTISHVDLTAVSKEEAKREIEESKRHIEDLTGREVSMFGYPKGKHDAQTKELVRAAGFAGARTVENIGLEIGDDPYQMGATLQVYPFPLRKKYFGRRIFLPLNYYSRKMREYRLPFKSYLSWRGLARGFFDVFKEKGGVFHLWGHSWEIEKYGMWQDLERFFEYASGRDDVEYLTNGEMIASRKAIEL